MILLARNARLEIELDRGFAARRVAARQALE